MSANGKNRKECVRQITSDGALPLLSACRYVRLLVCPGVCGCAGVGSCFYVRFTKNWPVTALHLLEARDQDVAERRSEENEVQARQWQRSSAES